jgi:hypothetical protein
MIRELIDTELDTVAGGLFNANFVLQSINAPQTATANANGIGFFGAGVGGVATAVNVGGANVNSSVIS